jgi:integrase
LLHETADDPIYPAVLLGAFYGLRRSEILGLRWRNVDLESGVFTICNTVVQHGAIIEKPRTKNEASRRALPLAPSVKTYLTDLQARQAENAAFFQSDYTPGDFVVKQADGTPFKPNFITDRFRRIMLKSKLPYIRFHDLRHTAATMLLAQGFSMKEIQEWLGHSDITTTSKIYAHLQFKAKQNMANRMDGLIDIR